MSIIDIIIPARYGSKRLEGKPLIKVAGIALVERMYRLATKVSGVRNVLIATDNERISSFCHEQKIPSVITSVDCRTGTDRCLEATNSLSQSQRPDYIINLQGDAVLTPPWIIQSMVDEINNTQPQVITPALSLDEDAYRSLVLAKQQTPTSGTFVVFSQSNRALYFSKNPIPYIRNNWLNTLPVGRHIGLYGYKLTVLEEIVAMASTPLEDIEGLEQLRLLENDITIKVVLVDYRGRSHGSIDCQQDISRVETIIHQEGELF
jgi:3-deoxy-manno-octulosonate cytidylyltransferase (CMP-KDO synthetase)